MARGSVGRRRGREGEKKQEREKGEEDGGKLGEPGGVVGRAEGIARGGRGGVSRGGRAAKRTFNKRCAEIAPLPRSALFTGARQLSGRVPPQSPPPPPPPPPRYTRRRVARARVYTCERRSTLQHNKLPTPSPSPASIHRRALLQPTFVVSLAGEAPSMVSLAPEPRKSVAR